MSKLTPWFPPEVKPVHVGVYIATVNRNERFYRRWDGQTWHYGSGNPHIAATMNEPWDSYHAAIHWRGLAEPPKGAA